MVTIFTDGAARGNPGPGGWGAIILTDDTAIELGGREDHTTNNRMELMAVIEAVRALTQSCDISIHSDSAYVCNAFHQNWLNNWQANGWKAASKRDVENQDLWRDLLGVLSKHSYKFVKVKGHSDNTHNNRCDELARLAIRQALDSQSL